MAIFRRKPPNGASNAGGVGKNRNSEPISGFVACCEPLQRQYAIHLAATDHGEFITLVSGKRRSLLMAGNNDKVNDKKFNVTPKTTLHSGKSEA